MKPNVRLLFPHYPNGTPAPKGEAGGITLQPDGSIFQDAFGKDTLTAVVDGERIASPYVAERDCDTIPVVSIQLDRRTARVDIGNYYSGTSNAMELSDAQIAAVQAWVAAPV